MNTKPENAICIHPTSAEETLALNMVTIYNLFGVVSTVRLLFVVSVTVALLEAFSLSFCLSFSFCFYFFGL